MINQEDPGVTKDILLKSIKSMVNGGLWIMQEKYRKTEKTGLSLLAGGINQLVHTPAGTTFLADKVADMVEEVEFTNLQFQDLFKSPFIHPDNGLQSQIFSNKS